MSQFPPVFLFKIPTFLKISFSMGCKCYKSKPSSDNFTPEKAALIEKLSPLFKEPIPKPSSFQDFSIPKLDPKFLEEYPAFPERDLNKPPPPFEIKYCDNFKPIKDDNYSATMLFMKNRIDEAFKEFERVRKSLSLLAAKPERTKVLFQYGLARFFNSEFDKAIELFERAFEIKDSKLVEFDKFEGNCRVWYGYTKFTVLQNQ